MNGLAKFLRLILFILLTNCSHQNSALNSPEALKAPYVILISIDGMRTDYINKYTPPTLSKMANECVKAKGLRPIFPSKTFPNHFSLVTGMYAENHGLLSNEFLDVKNNKKYSLGDRKEVENPHWYQGTPIWVSAAKKGMVTASFFWVGSEAPIQGRYPDYWYSYDNNVPGEKRVEQVIKWLELEEKKRPHLITLYFSNVDSAGHKYGPDSDEVKEALWEIDANLKTLYDYINKSKLPISVILVSDHGMRAIHPTKAVYLDKILTLDSEDEVSGKGSFAMLYIKDKTKLPDMMKALKNLPNGKAYLRDNTPAKWHFKHERAGDIIISMNQGYYLLPDKKHLQVSVQGGTHGYDPYVDEQMHGTFIAWGDQIDCNKKIGVIDNINVAPFILELLNISDDTKRDSKGEALIALKK